MNLNSLTWYGKRPLSLTADILFWNAWMIVALFAIASSAHADQTTGGINWLDPLGYQKPQFVSISIPNEASVANKYYVDLASGSGTTCSQASPCALSSVAGKPGTAGGPAYIYLRGTGAMYLYLPSKSFYGSPGNEIVLKPWSGYTATITDTGVNNLTGANIHHWIFDGGPDMGIKFLAANVSGNVALRVNSDNHTFYRVQGTCNNNVGNEILMTSEGQATNLSIVNSEFYDCVGGSGAQQSAVYMGGSSCNDGTSGFSNFTIKNSIIRNMGGEGIELNPRTASSGVTIVGNAFHNIGKQTCSGGWDCRPAVTVDGPSCGGSSSNVYIANNLMFDIGASCIWSKGGGKPQTFDNNTCYDHGKGASHGVCMQGICGGTAATVRNNIIYAPNGTKPFDTTSFAAANNLCVSGGSCGTSAKAWSANTVLSVAQSDPGFLKIGGSSEAAAGGVNLFSAGLTLDYLGLARSSTGAFDIGAFMLGGTASTLPPPGNVRVLSN